MMHQAIEKIVQHTGASVDAARSNSRPMNPEGRIATVEEVAHAALELICGDTERHLARRPRRPGGVTAV